jgi:glutathione synthase
VILMRKDPPFDMEFVYSTYLLEQAERAGVLVVNRRRACATATRSCSPRCSRSARRRPWSAAARHLREFAAKHGDVILKPLDGMGGTSIFRHRAGDPNLSVILETLTARAPSRSWPRPTCRRSRTATSAS